MNHKDLIGIGRLGGMDSDGYFHAMIKPVFKSVLSGLTECFLIFSSDRVFFVTICDIKHHDKKTWIRFLEDGIPEERMLHKEVILALDEYPDSAENQDENEEPMALIGFTVIHEGQELGVLEDYFDNTAQYVLVIKSLSGKEILVPYVDYFVQSVMYETKVLVLQNAESLIEI